jgi:hypothetical protein
MTIAALQKRVVQNISSVNDEQVLKKINQLIDESSKVYVLSDYQLDLLKEADEDSKTGNIFTQEEMDKKVEEWKKRK